MRMLLSSLLVAQLALAAGCGGSASPVAPDRAADGPQDARQQAAAASIRDGAHDGPEGFYFLPPLVPEPTFSGTFDPDRSPTVQICELTDAGCEPVVATCTRETGPGSETVRVDTVAEQYVVDWHTDRFELVEGATYRVRVLLDGREAGHADVVVVTSGTELKSAETGEQIALKDGRTLPITFRIERGLVLELTVPAVTPDGVPDSIFDAENVITDSPIISGAFLRNIVLVVFREGASRAERQEAVDLVDGVVVGGVRAFGDDGYYFVRIEDDGTAKPLLEAIEKLKALPQVVLASPELLSPGLESYRRPKDGSGFEQGDWELNSDDASGANWALERIDAPLGWGCSIGDRGTGIAVVDRDFHAISELTDNLDTSLGLGVFPRGTDHGTLVASVLAASGNDTTKITGTMWRAGLRLLDYGVDPAGNITRDPLGRPAARLSQLMDRVLDAGRGGAVVINMSVGADTLEFVNPGPSAPKGDSTTALDIAAHFYRAVEDLDDDGIKPLIVIGAGNGGRGTLSGIGIDAFWAAFPIVRDSFPDRILVVAATEQNGQKDAIAVFSNDNSGEGEPNLVEIAAPGVDITTLVDGEQVVSRSGTFVAAPRVSGVAGLLASFDPRLSAAQIKQLILAGADRGGRSVAGGGAGDIPLLNAHEALKAAAERDGAPLCGNRVWAGDDAIVAEREGGTTETLQSGLGAENVLGRVEALHGGKFVSFLKRDTMTGGTTDTLVIEWQRETGEWMQVGTAVSDLPAVRGGTHASVFGLSHGRDTLAVIDGDEVWGTRWYETADRNQAPVRLEVPPGGTGTQVGAIPVEDFEEEIEETCLERDASNPDTCFLATQESRFWLFRIGYPQFPSAVDERPASVAVSPLRTVVDSTGAWETCSFDASRECRATRTVQQPFGALATRMDLAGTGNRPVRLDSLAQQSIFWIGQGESGEQVVLGRGVAEVTFRAHPDSLRSTGSLFFGFEGDIRDCVVEYRDRATFEPTREAVPAPDACFFAIDFDELDPAAGGGTIAPSVRAGDGTGPRTVPMPLVELLPEGPGPGGRRGQETGRPRRAVSLPPPLKLELKRGARARGRPSALVAQRD